MYCLHGDIIIRTANTVWRRYAVRGKLYLECVQDCFGLRWPVQEAAPRSTTREQRVKQMHWSVVRNDKVKSYGLMSTYYIERPAYMEG